MDAWKKIWFFAVAGLLLAWGGIDPSYAQDTGAKVDNVNIIDFTFRDISLGDDFETARAKAEKLNFKFFLIKEALPGTPDFIRLRNCQNDQSCGNVLIYFDFTNDKGYVSRIVYTNPVLAPLKAQDIISALEKSYGTPAMKAKGKAGSGDHYILWGGDNKPDAFSGAKLDKTPKIVGGRYMLASILKDKHGILNLTFEITDSVKLADGKKEIKRLKKSKIQQEKKLAIKKMKFR